MKFVFITREGYREAGARVRCYNFAEKLKEKGLNSEVFSFADRLGAKSGKDEVDFNLREKLRYVYKGFKSLSKSTDENIFIVNRFNYHTIPAWLVSKLNRLCLIFDMDDWEAREDLGYYFGCFPKSKAEYLARLFAKDSIFCFAASHYLRDYLLQFNPEVYYIPTGCDLNRFSPSVDRNDKNFIFSWHGALNRIELVKYLEFVINCFLILLKKHPFIRLNIAGDGMFRGELIKLLKRYHCENIIYKGWIDYDAIPSYLDQIDAGLIPVLDKTHFNLSKCPVKLFEYMAKAKPVVASPVGEASFVIKDSYNGFLSSDKDEFIFNMERLINDFNLVKDLGINAHNTVKLEYSLDVLGNRLYEVIRANCNI